MVKKASIALSNSRQASLLCDCSTGVVAPSFKVNVSLCLKVVLRACRRWSMCLQTKCLLSECSQSVIFQLLWQQKWVRCSHVTLFIMYVIKHLPKSLTSWTKDGPGNYASVLNKCHSESPFSANMLIQVCMPVKLISSHTGQRILSVSHGSDACKCVCASYLMNKQAKSVRPKAYSQV